VSIQDERELRDSLSGLLDRVEPAPPPVGAVMRTGKAIRTRRRLAIVGGLAAIVAAAVLVPTLILQPRPAPTTHQRNFKVSIHQPRKNDPPNLIAYGSADGWNWKATVVGGRRPYPTVEFSGIPNSANLGGQLTDPGPLTSNTGVFAPEGTTGGRGANTVDEMVSRVSPGVTHITMTAANGTVLDLHPVHYRKMSLIALVLPHGLRILRADAYTRSGEVRYAIPFFYRGSNSFEVWLHTSQSPPTSLSAHIPMVLGSTRSEVSVHIGPWGTCEDVLVPGGFDQGCSPTTPTSKLAQFDMGSGTSVIGVTRDDVAYFELDMSDGSTVRVPVVHLRGIGYYAVGHATNPKVISWTAFDAVGIELGSGHGVPGALQIPKHS